MKKTVIASVTFAVALFAVSCRKEITTVQNVSGPMTISAVAEGLDTPTKTEMAFKYDVLWSANDTIWVVDGSGNHDTFSLQDGAGTTKGIFKQDGQVPLSGDVQAYYPATMIQGENLVWPASQTNSQAVPMYCKHRLSGSTYQRMDFTSLGSVLQIVFNTTQENVTLKFIEIKDGGKTMSGAFHVDENGKAIIDATDNAGIVLDLGKGVALGKGANYFNIAVPAGNYQDLTIIFTASDGGKCTITEGKVDILHNTVGKIVLTGGKFYGVLAGVFTVADDDQGNVKKVRFSKGNLWADGSKALHFEDAQWKSTPTSDGSIDKNHVSHFTWSSTVEKAVGYEHDGDFLFCDESHKQSVDGSDAIYYALSRDEWKYLFNNHSYKWVTVNGVHGYVIAPDNFSGTIAGSYADDAALATDNLVFLPAAGSRRETATGVGSYGYYWSSSSAAPYYVLETAYTVNFDKDVLVQDQIYYRAEGNSVRLITDVK